MLTRTKPSTWSITGASILRTSVNKSLRIITRLKRLTNGAPMKAISKGMCCSLVRHWTHGSRAKVVMPENIASAVTGGSWRGQTLTEAQAVAEKLAFPKVTIYGLWKLNIFKGYLVKLVVVMGSDANKINQQGEDRENLLLHDGKGLLLWPTWKR